MIHFILGTAKSGKTEYTLNLLKDKALGNENTALFVPEQFSFETERELIDRIGESSLRTISLYSFRWLCDEIKREHGGNAYETIDDNKRHLMMLKTLNSLQGELKIFKGEPSKNVESLIDAIVDFKTSGIKSSQLIEISKNISSGVLKDKLCDLSLVMSTYESLLLNKYIDPIDDLEFVYEIIKKNKFFKDKTVFFDGFSGFSGQQMKIVKRIIDDAKDVYFSFCSDGKTNDEFSVFSPVNKTIRIITDYAKNVAKKQINTPILLDKKLYDSEDLISVCDFFETKNPNKREIKNVSALTFSGKYDECEYAATMIHKLVRENGLRYRNFAFICRSSENYSGFIKSIFGKYDVPIFVNENRRLDNSLLTKLVSLLLSASRSFKSNDILSLIKTQLTDVSEKELFSLDNYIYLWNIDKHQWEEKWDFNPFGLKELSDKEKLIAKERLTELNKTREKIVSLLKPLNSIKQASAQEISTLLFSTMQKAKVGERLREIVSSLKDNGEYEEADFQTASWDAVIGVLDDVVEIFSDEVFSISEYSSIISKSFAIKTLGGIPQGLDEVIFTTPDKLRTYDIKVAFIAGFNYGMFPSLIQNKGIFSTTERAFLSDYLEDFSDKSLDLTLEENFAVYKALTSPKSKLVLMNYISEYSGSGCQISQTYSSICDYLGVSPEFIDINSFLSDYIETKSQAFSVASYKLRANQNSADLIFDALNKFDDFTAKIDAIKRSVNNTESRLLGESAEKIFGINLNASPSKIESYYKCPYAFFNKYGLNISKREKIDFMVMQRGTIAHYVLEKILNHYLFDSPQEDINNLSKLIDGYINEYIILTVGNYQSLDEYSKYIITRIYDMLVELCNYVLDEINNSEFKPKAFEFRIADETEVPPLIIDSEKGTVELSGVIDRVDSAKIAGKEYIRIIDYKTGKKDFVLSDILSGLNLQMFIYLCAIYESPNLQTDPAAVLYQPLNHVRKNGIEGKVDGSYSPKAKGILTTDNDVLSAMDPSGKYMPFSFNKDGSLSKNSHCIDSDDFEVIFSYVKKKVAQMHNELLSGEISKNPYANDSKNKTCTYCDYREICRYSFEEKSLPSLSIEDALKIMEEGEIIEQD